MPDSERIIGVVREWVAKAENDLKNAANTVLMGDDCPTDTVCFHAQQCVEKYLKAYLVFSKIEFSRTHDIEELIGLASEDVAGWLSVEAQRRLTEYATVSRYPGDYDPISLAEAQEALRRARRVREEVRKRLPKEALRLT